MKVVDVDKKNFSRYLFILDKDKRLRPAKSIDEWGAWFEDRKKRKVGMTRVAPKTYVSTICLGIPIPRWGTHKLNIFETMVFSELETPAGIDSKFENLQIRYVTYREALHGHRWIVSRMRRKFKRWRRKKTF